MVVTLPEHALEEAPLVIERERGLAGDRVDLEEPGHDECALICEIRVEPIRARRAGLGWRGGLRTEGGLLWVLVRALLDHVRELPLERGERAHDARQQVHRQRVALLRHGTLDKLSQVGDRAGVFLDRALAHLVRQAHGCVQDVGQLQLGTLLARHDR